MVSKAILMTAAVAALGAWSTWAPVPDPAAAHDVAVQDTGGKAIFLGKGMCSVCHGVDAKGTVLAPDLTDKEWLHSDGSLEKIAATIKTGVPQPKQHPGPMLPMGGAQLTEAEIQALARYVFSLRPPSQ